MPVVRTSRVGLRRSHSPSQEVHHRRSEKNAGKPDAPTEIKNVAADEKNGLPHSSRADFGEDRDARSETPDYIGCLEAMFLAGVIVTESPHSHRIQ